MRKRELKNVEWSLLIVAIILCTIGLVALFSATQSTDYDEFNKQCIWLIVSLVIMGAIMLIDYETLIKISPILYGIFIILLSHTRDIDEVRKYNCCASLYETYN